MTSSPGENALVHCVDEVLITSQLAARPWRPPDYETESLAMLELGDELRLNPRNILNKLAELAMKLCQADSAGISILESEDKREIFRWHAIAGDFAPNLYGSLPREASPCGTVIARNSVLLFNEPDRYYAELRGVSPRVYESLLAPWPSQGRPEGTLWVVAHTPERHFDAEDARIVQILARFASGAHHAVAELVKAKASQEDLEKRVEESAFLLSDTFKALRKEMEGHDQANSKRRQAERALREIEKRERSGE